MFMKNSKKATVFLPFYVYDLLIIVCSHAVKNIKRKLRTLFEVMGLGQCSYFLGIRLQHTKTGIFLSQSAYAERVIETASISTSRPTSTPLPLSHSLYDEEMPPSPIERFEMQKVPYREVLGCLLYLVTRTRPDIATAVYLLAKYQSDPSPQHFKMRKYVLQYLTKTVQYGLCLPSFQSG